MEEAVKTKVGFQVAAYMVGATVGIETADAEKVVVEDNKIYNLAGQQVNKVTKGIYIKNGKKFIAK